MTTGFETAYQDYQEDIDWEQGRAQEHCTNVGENCDGPTVSNIGFGPDAGGSKIIATCNHECAQCIREQMEGAWVVTHESATT